MQEMNHYVTVTPDGKERFFEIYGDGYQAAEMACRQSGITSHRRAEPTVLAIAVYAITLKGGQSVRWPKNVYMINAPLARMTREDYDIEMKEALSGLPEEFASWVSFEANERGHSVGMEEVVLIATNMAYDLSKVVAAYTKRIAGAKQ